MKNHNATMASSAKPGLLIYSPDRDLINNITAVSQGEYLIKLASNPRALDEALANQQGNIAIIMVDMTTIAAVDIKPVMSSINKAGEIVAILVSKKGLVNSKITTSLHLQSLHIGLKRDFSTEEGQLALKEAMNKLKLESQGVNLDKTVEMDVAAIKAVASRKKAIRELENDLRQVSTSADNRRVKETQPGHQKQSPFSLPVLLGVPAVLVLLAGVYFTTMKLSISEAESSTASPMIVKETIPAASDNDLIAIESLSSQIDSLLARANAALQYGDLVTPEKLSALHYYTQALEIDPENKKVRMDVNEFIGRVLRDIEPQLQAYQLLQANQTVDKIRVLQPGDSRFSRFDSKMKQYVNEAIAESKVLAAKGEAKKATAMLVQVADVLSIDREVLLSLHSDISDATEKQEKIETLLASFSERMQEGRLISPEADNAKYYILTLKTLAPGHDELNTNLMLLGNRMLEKVDAALNISDLDTAQNWMKHVRALEVLQPAISQRTVLLEEALTQQRLRIAEQKRQAHIQLLMTNLDRQLVETDILATGENSPNDTLQLLYEVATDDVEIQPAIEQFTGALMQEIDAGLREGNLQRVDDLITYAEAREFNLDMQAINLQLAAARVGDTEQEKVMLASTSPTLGRPYNNEESLKPIKLVKSSAPSYPPRALRRNIQGWVHLAFTVDGQGQTSAIEVIEASPAEIFNDSAIRAVKKFKYAVVEDALQDDTDLATFTYRDEIKLRFELEQ